jgi:hypothetical protein
VEEAIRRSAYPGHADVVPTAHDAHVRESVALGDPGTTIVWTSRASVRAALVLAHTSTRRSLSLEILRRLRYCSPHERIIVIRELQQSWKSGLRG